MADSRIGAENIQGEPGAHTLSLFNGGVSEIQEATKKAPDGQAGKT